MKAISIHSKAELETYLLKHRPLNVYHIGDLDDFFWPYTHWYACKDGEDITAVALLFTALDIPIFLAIDNHNTDEMLALIGDIAHLLPNRFYSLISPRLEEPLQDTYDLEDAGEHYIMALTDITKVTQVSVDTFDIRALIHSDLDDIEALYSSSYPGHWFTERMLATGKYFGLRDDEEQLVSIAGIHVYSAEYKLAALGNITTHPDARGRGFGKAVTAALCQDLLKTVGDISLTVQAANQQAIHIYEKLGFEIVTNYNEFTFNRK
ncbi:MAG: GNAT family N-acetyltransferase [Chloroflexi bacterium]|nr:MAG: GNAT family N-acetyltransferase [Chloroflexota bacterium]MBL1196175.1 GNAT family N-acetyltransferase [Chloroflexota bacterium]NOH13468.1 GNAT family N-acetyltransferase [Chloroflexota bacterium]